MDGDVSQRSLTFAKYYGDLTYIKNKNVDGKKVINLIQDEEQWKEQLRADLTSYFKAGPQCRVCIVSQSSTKVDALYREIREEFPHLVAKKLVGQDGGETNERISKTSTKHSMTQTCSFIVP